MVFKIASNSMHQNGKEDISEQYINGMVEAIFFFYCKIILNIKWETSTLLWIVLVCMIWLHKNKAIQALYS